MIRRSPLRPPGWPAVVAVVVAALVLRVLGWSSGGDGLSWAFLGFVQGAIVIGAAVWRWVSRAVTAATKALIRVIQWTLNNLVRVVVASIKKTAVFFARVAAATGRFIKRAWVTTVRSLQRAVIWLKGTLSNIFRPVFDFLNRMKDHIKRFYIRFVRPVLDVIEFARHAFRLLGYLGVDWARRLDAKLGQIEALISLPFEWAIGKINEIIGVLNRLVLANGLLQRLPLLLSLMRDYPQTTNMFFNGLTRPMSGLERARWELRPRRVPARTALEDVERHVIYQDSDNTPAINEIVTSIRLTLDQRRRGRGP